MQTGHWPLYRYQPGGGEVTTPFQLDSSAPSLPYAEFLRSEARFGMLVRTDPDRAAQLQVLAEADVADRWKHYEQLAGVERAAPSHADEATIADSEDE